jgi:CRP-like cAMP-binding protein
LNRGDLNDKFYFILEGELDQYYPSGLKNDKIVISRLRKGDYFGKESFFMNVSENFSVISRSIVTLAYMEK